MRCNTYLPHFVFAGLAAMNSRTSSALNLRPFPIWMATNSIWAWADLSHGLPQQGVLHVVYLGLAVYGTWHWRRRPRARSVDSKSTR